MSETLDKAFKWSREWLKYVVADGGTVDDSSCMLSIAISLNRIADALEILQEYKESEHREAHK